MNKLHEYNGWENKPTWIINDWILSDEYLLKYMERQGLDIIEHYEYETGSIQFKECKYEYADLMKSYFEDLVYEQQEKMDDYHLFDLLNFAFAYVNWDELAESYLENIISERKYIEE